MEWVLSPELTGFGHRKNPFGEALTRFGLVSETLFSPLDGGTDSPLSGIVRGLYSLMGEESE